MNSKQRRLVVSLLEENAIIYSDSLKILDNDFSLHGFKFRYPLCCVIWFCNIECTLRKTLPEYSSTMYHLSDNGGRVLYPDCLIDRFVEFCVAP